MSEIRYDFFRTCQECGHVQRDKEPTDTLKQDERRFNAWLEKPCKRCRSEALDYGSSKPVDAVGRPRELTKEEYDRLYPDE